MEETKTEKYFLEDSIVFLGKSAFFIAEYKEKVFLLEYDPKLIQDGFLEEYTVGYKMLIGSIEPHVSMPLEIAKRHLSYFSETTSPIFNELPEIGERCIFWNNNHVFCIGEYKGFVLDEFYRLFFKCELTETHIAQFPYISLDIEGTLNRKR